jgi:zinc and cadmium transporter
MTVWIYTLASVLVVSLISIAGILTVSLKENALKDTLLFLVSFSAGALMGDAFLHLLPEAISRSGFTIYVSLYVLLGILLFFVLEKIIFWRHCHIPTSEDHPHPFAYMSLVGDGLHNIIDGMIIAGSYLVSVPLGITTTIAVLAHEIPQEMGDFGILVYGGFSFSRALLLNFLVALTAFLGAVFVLLLSAKAQALTSVLVPLTAGNFIYIAGSDLIPELKKHVELSHSAVQLLALVLGIALLVGLKLFS